MAKTKHVTRNLDIVVPKLNASNFKRQAMPCEFTQPASSHQMSTRSRTSNLEGFIVLTPPPKRNGPKRRAAASLKYASLGYGVRIGRSIIRHSTRIDANKYVPELKRTGLNKEKQEKRINEQQRVTRSFATSDIPMYELGPRDEIVERVPLGVSQSAAKHKQVLQVGHMRPVNNFMKRALHFDQYGLIAGDLTFTAKLRQTKQTVATNMGTKTLSELEDDFAPSRNEMAHALVNSLDNDQCSELFEDEEKSSLPLPCKAFSQAKKPHLQEAPQIQSEAEARPAQRVSSINMVKNTLLSGLMIAGASWAYLVCSNQ